MTTPSDLDNVNAELDAHTAALAAVNSSLDAIEAILTQTPKFARLNLSASGDTTVVAAVPSKKIRVLNYFVTTQTANAAVTVAFKSGSSTILGEIREIDGLYPAAMPGNLLGPLFETAAGEALVVNLSAAKVVSGHLTYVEVG